MEYLKINEFLEKNNLTNKDMDKIILKVSRTNWKLEKILADTGKHWSELNISLLQSAVDLFREVE